jgi:hypothetical protein
VERGEVTRLFKQEPGELDGKTEPEKCSLPIRLAQVMLVDGRHTQTNNFVVLMFIHLQNEDTGFGEHQHSTTTARRVLLDTGAEFNLISHSAHAELNLERQPYQGLVHSIGGYTELDGTVFLRWHFRISDSGGRPISSLHCAPFVILPKESDVRFDCILGQPWISDNWAEFNALVEMNRKREALGHRNTKV